MKIHKTIINTLFLGVFMFVAIAANAQVRNISKTDLSKVNVDQLSDDQVKTLLNKAELSGMTQDQIEVAAKAKGMSSLEIIKLKARIRNLKIYSTTAENVVPEQTNDTKSLTDSVAKAINKFNEKIFGFSLFTNKSLSFEPSTNVATPMNYQLGPGDKFVIDVWGASQETYNSKITAEGNIIISNVGPIYISGMTIEEATVKIKKELSTIYSGLLTGNTFMKISLSAARSIKVNIVGDVVVPGTYSVSSLSTVFNAMYLAGGPSLNGSLRDVKIIRNNKTVADLDFYEFLLKGELPDNMRLQDEDVIFVSTYKKRVEIIGEIKRSALLFDIKPTETLKDLIYFAGGFTDKAYSEWIKIFRKTGKEYKVIDVSSSQRDTFKLNNGDSIMVDTILNRFENRVEIKGAVFRPGIFAIDSVMTLKQLINKAEGLRGDAFKNRISIYRTTEDLTIEIIPFDLEKLLRNEEDVSLQREDIVIIPSIFDISEEYNLNIEGEIKNPGKYPFTFNTSVEDLIIQAGGLLESASLARMEIARRIKNNTAVSTNEQIAEIYQFPISKDLKLSDSASKFILQPFDQIFIRKSPGYLTQEMVSVEGEVLFPGKYCLTSKNERISDLVKRSGNYTTDAYPEGARMIRKFTSDQPI